MPHSSRRLLKTPTERSEARSVRAAKAVPIWPATMPEEGHRRGLQVGVVQRGARRRSGRPGASRRASSTKKKPAIARARARSRPRNSQARSSIGALDDALARAGAAGGP